MLCYDMFIYRLYMITMVKYDKIRYQIAKHVYRCHKQRIWNRSFRFCETVIKIWIWIFILYSKWLIERKWLTSIYLVTLCHDAPYDFWWCSWSSSSIAHGLSQLPALLQLHSRQFFDVVNSACSSASFTHAHHNWFYHGILWSQYTPVVEESSFCDDSF